MTGKMIINAFNEIEKNGFENLTFEDEKQGENLKIEFFLNGRNVKQIHIIDISTGEIRAVSVENFATFEEACKKAASVFNRMKKN